MYSFGKTPVDLENFGVSGLLDEAARIFYSPLFSTKHIGRVSDLICAELNGAGIDVLKLRTLLTLEVFHAYRGQTEIAPSDERHSSSGETQSLESPLALECGIDWEKLALCISFALGSGHFLHVEGISERVFNKAPSDSFEEMLVKLQEYSDRLVLKFHPHSRKTEVSVLIGINGMIDPQSIKEKVPMEVVVIERPDVRHSPKPKAYVNLGDMDFPTLLREDVLKKLIRESPTGEFFIPGQADSLDGRTQIGGINDSEDIFKLNKKPLDSEEEIRIGGVTQNIQEDILRVEGAGEAPPKKRRFGRIRQPLRKLFGRFLSSDDVPELPPMEEPAEITLVSEQEQGETLPDLGEFQPETGIEDAPAEMSDVDLEAESQRLLAQLDGGLGKTVTEAEVEMRQLKSEIRNPKIAKWVEKLIYNLIGERKRLNDMAKKVNHSVRTKEIEFNGRLIGLQDEIRKKDLQIVEKTHAILRSREQLAHLTQNLEKIKMMKQSNSEDFHSKQKLELTQRMLAAAKDENLQYAHRIEELRKQLNVALSGKPKGPSNSDFIALQERYERLTWQAEEFKKANRNLMERLNEPRRDRGSGNLEEMKRRLEASMKVVTANQKEMEALRTRIHNFQNLEVKMRMEMEHLRSELKRTKEGGGSAAPPKAA